MAPVASPVTPAADDHALIRRYLADRDSSSFATLVHRYVLMVYSAAARRVGDRHLAEDITQAVFVILARKAGSVPTGQSLSAWLLTTTRYAAANALKIESRRRRHEEAAAMSHATTTAGATAGACSADPAAAILWQDVAARLDDAVLKLPAPDRQAVLLRYFEDRPLRDIAAALNCSEGAVKQRLSRALGRLRSRLDRTTGGALAAVPAAHFASLLTSHAVAPAPAGLAAAATSAALTHSAVALSAAATTSATLTPHIAKGAMHMMNWTKAKLVASLVAAVTLGGAGGVITLNRALAQSDATPKQPVPAQQAHPKKAPPKTNGAPAADDAKSNKKDNYLGIVTVEDAPPVVVETSPKSGANDVDPATTELKVTFSKDMQNGNWSWAQISNATFPAVTAKPHYEPDHRTCVLPVKLEPNHTYVIQLNYPPFDSFSDPDGRKAVRYLFVFQTRN